MERTDQKNEKNDETEIIDQAGGIDITPRVKSS